MAMMPTSEDPSAATQATATETSPAWPILTPHERRVLGVFVEKAKTTPDVYPLSLNALVTGCNQKSNRDPAFSLSELEVEDALVSAQRKGLAIKITGGRVVRWRHALYEAFRADKVELAVLAELLLRGPQTEGELRSRASRMEAIDDLDALRGVLRRLAERRLVVYVSPENRRGTMVTHGFHAPEELDHLRAAQGMAVFVPDLEESTHLPSNRHAAEPSPSLEARHAEIQAEVARLRNQMADLQAKFLALTDHVRELKEMIET